MILNVEKCMCLVSDTQPFSYAIANRHRLKIDDYNKIIIGLKNDRVYLNINAIFSIVFLKAIGSESHFDYKRKKKINVSDQLG